MIVSELMNKLVKMPQDAEVLVAANAVGFNEIRNVHIIPVVKTAEEKEARWYVGEFEQIHERSSKAITAIQIS